MRYILAILLVLLCLPTYGGAAWEQRLGAALPLDLTFIDEAGHRTQLGNYFGSVPVVIVFGYFHCARLCPEVFAGVREGLHDAQLISDRDYRLLAVSIDPGDTPVSAEPRAELLGEQPGVHLLTSRTGSESQLARVAGFSYARTSNAAEFAHPAGFLIATPRGIISHYFFGVRFPPAEIRDAIAVAREDRIGTLADRLLLLCSSLASTHSAQSASILITLRAVVLVMLGALALYFWRAFRGRASK